MVGDGVVYLGFSDGHAAALEAKTGAAIWDRVLSTGTQFIDVSSSPGFDSAGHLIAASYKDGLFALDPKTGDTIWQSTAVGSGLGAGPGGGHLRRGRGWISAFSAETGRKHLGDLACPIAPATSLRWRRGSCSFRPGRRCCS